MVFVPCTKIYHHRNNDNRVTNYMNCDIERVFQGVSFLCSKVSCTADDYSNNCFLPNSTL